MAIIQGLVIDVLNIGSDIETSKYKRATEDLNQVAPIPRGIPNPTKNGFANPTRNGFKNPSM